MDRGHAATCAPAAVAIEIRVIPATCDQTQRPVVRPFDLARYSVLRKLGEGVYGSVSLMQIPDSADEIAVKRMISKSTFSPDDNMLHEVDAINVRHPNVAGICMAGYTDAAVLSTFMNVQATTLLNLVEDSATDRMFKKPPLHNPFDDMELEELLYQMVAGASALHARLILHNDLKLNNILAVGKRARADPDNPDIGNFKQLVVADLGLSRSFIVEPTRIAIQHLPECQAPEILSGGPRAFATYKSEAWTVGVLLYIVATGVIPFGEHPTVDLIMRRLKQKAFWKKLERLPEALADLVKKMLDPDPLKRLNVFEAAAHPYFGSGKIRVEAVLNMPKVVPLEFVAGMRVSPASALRVLREMEAEGGAGELDRAKLQELTRDILGFMANRKVRTIELASQSFALCVRALRGRSAGETVPVESVTAGACVILASLYRIDSLADQIHPETKEAEYSMRKVTERLDMCMMVPSVYDFLRQLTEDSQERRTAAMAALCAYVGSDVFMGIRGAEVDATECLELARGKSPPYLGAAVSSGLQYCDKIGLRAIEELTTVFENLDIAVKAF